VGVGVASNPSLDAMFQARLGASFIANGAAAPKNSALASAGADLDITATGYWRPSSTASLSRTHRLTSAPPPCAVR